MISGCAALPVPIQIASWALDGLSVITTEKSLSDHGLSLVTQQDCALWRGFTDGEICREESIGIDVLTASVTGDNAPWQPVTSITAFSSAPSLNDGRPVLQQLYLDVI